MLAARTTSRLHKCVDIAWRPKVPPLDQHWLAGEGKEELTQLEQCAIWVNYNFWFFILNPIARICFHDCPKDCLCVIGIQRTESITTMCTVLNTRERLMKEVYIWRWQLELPLQIHRVLTLVKAKTERVDIQCFFTAHLSLASVCIHLVMIFSFSVCTKISE